MTTATMILSYGTGSDAAPQKGEILAGLYQWFMEKVHSTMDPNAELFDKNDKTLPIQPDEVSAFQETLASVSIRKENLEAIKLLDEWFAEPDDLGDAFWKEYEQQLQDNKFTIS